MFLGIIFLTVGLLSLGQQLGYISASLELFWPVIFIAMGLSLVFGKKGPHGRFCGPWCGTKLK